MRTDGLFMIRNGAIVPTSNRPILLPANDYINFGSTSGTGGYGIRDNAGVLEFKNSGGSWTAFGAGGGGTLTVKAVSGTLNGVNTAFTIPSTYTGASAIDINGQMYLEGPDYSHSGTTITFVVAPPDFTGYPAPTFSLIHA